MFNFQLAISEIAGPVIIFSLLFIISIFLLITKRKTDALVLVLSSSISILITEIIKFIFKIPRPIDALILENGYRFPSGHATMAAVVATLIICYAYLKIKNKTFKYATMFLGLCWYVLVSYSRVYLGVHYMVDLRVGGIIGALCTYIVFYNLKLKTKFLNKKML